MTVLITMFVHELWCVMPPIKRHFHYYLENDARKVLGVDS